MIIFSNFRIMRKVFSFLAAVATLFVVMGCKKSIEQPVVEPEYQEVTMSVGIASSELVKALGNGALADRLDMAVYHKGQYISSIQLPSVGKEGLNATVIGTPGKWRVTLTLAKNVKYDIVFWAHAEGAPYKFNKAEHQIVVDYDGLANDEVRDAFYERVEGYVVTDTPVDVELRRPFAQINIGASDYDPYITDFRFKMTSAITCKAPSVLDVLDGSVSEEVELEFDLAPIPYESGNQVLTKVGGVTYHWMSMNYILADQSNTNIYGDIKATFHYNDSDLEVSIPSVPYRRNYRTNILGTLFTGPAKFDVEVVPGFAGDIMHDINY